MEESVEAPIETVNDQGSSTPEKPEPVVDADSNAKEEVLGSEDCEEAEVEDEHQATVATSDEQRLTEQPIEEKSGIELVDGKGEEDEQPENLVDKAEMGQSSSSSRQMLLDQAGILLGRDKNSKSTPKPVQRDDEDLEKYSEALMDNGSSGEEQKEPENGKRVRFADEVVKIPERSKNAPQSVPRREQMQEHSPENVPNGASDEVND